MFLSIRSYEDAVNLFIIHWLSILFLIILGIILNVRIYMTMVRRKRYKRNASNFFILHLCSTELVYRLLVFPLTIYFVIPRSATKQILCKLVFFFSGTWRSTIFGSLAAIAIVRYQHVVHHFESLKSSKGSRTPLVLMVWLYAALTSFPLAIGVKNVPVVSIPEA